MKTLKVKLHSGLQSDCRVCTEAPVKKKWRDKKITKRESSIVTGDIATRRQLAAEIGEEEPDKDERFILLQKYGIAVARIDRGVTKPSWMSEETWKRKQSEWFRATKGLVAPQQQKRSLNSRTPLRRTFPPTTILSNLPAGLTVHYYPKRFPTAIKTSRPNSDQTKTAIRPS